MNDVLKYHVKPRLRRAEAEARGETEANAEAEARRAVTREEPRKRRRVSQTQSVCVCVCVRTHTHEQWKPKCWSSCCALANVRERATVALHVISTSTPTGADRGAHLAPQAPLTRATYARGCIRRAHVTTRLRKRISRIFANNDQI